MQALHLQLHRWTPPEAFAADAIRLHLPGIPHTVTNAATSHCAFTGKVLRMGRMMALVKNAEGKRMYEVIHYGAEGAEECADAYVDLLSTAEWQAARCAAFVQKFGPLADVSTLDDPRRFVGDLSDISQPLYTLFNARLAESVRAHYRSKAGDIFLMPFGHGHKSALDTLNREDEVLAVESGIGYPNAFHKFRVFESATWMAWHLGHENVQPSHYWFVAPNYFDEDEWPASNKNSENIGRPRIGFMGRVCAVKGLWIISNVAVRMPEYDFVVRGQGDTAEFARGAPPNLSFEEPLLHGNERGAWLCTLDAFFSPSIFLEPFHGALVEAQLCGVPVVTTAAGAATETVEHGVTGFLCHTAADFCDALRRVVHTEGRSCEYIRSRAQRLYGLAGVARRYDVIFRTLVGLYQPHRAWDGNESRLLDDVWV